MLVKANANKIVPFPDGSTVKGEQVHLVKDNLYTRRRIKEGDLIVVTKNKKSKNNKG